MVFIRVIRANAAIAALAVALWFGDSSSAQRVGGAPQATRHVLLLNSYHRGYEWSDRIVDGIEAHLPFGTTLHVEYMDTKRYQSEDHLRRLQDLYASKYPPGFFDVVIVTDDNAYTFVRKRQAALWPNTPVVFCGVGQELDPDVEDDPLWTGIHQQLELEGAVDLIQHLHPGMRQLLFVSGHTPSSQAWREEVQRLREQLPADAGLELVDVGPGLDLAGLTEALASAPVDSCIFFCGFAVDREGRYLDIDQVVEQLSKEASAPIYSHTMMYMGHGIVGGYMSDGYELGGQVASMAQQIMDGASPADIPIQPNSPRRYIFDDVPLKRWRIAPEALPEGSEILNPPSSFYARYRTVILLTSLFVLIQTAIIIGLVWNIIHRRRSEQARRASEATLASIFRAAPAGMGLTIDRVIQRVNERMCQMTGYTRDELVGNSARMLYPSDETYAYVGQEKYRQMQQADVGTVETQWRLRDGQIIDVLLSSSHIHPDRPEHGVSFTAFDITERKRAEAALRQSEHRFRELAEHMDEVFWIDDMATGKTLYVSPAIEPMWGLTAEQVLGDPDIWQKSIHPDDAGRVHKAVMALRDGEPMDVEFRIIRPDGSVRWVQDQGFPVIEDDKVIRTAGLVTDITDRQHTEDQIRNLARFPEENPSPVLRLDADGGVLYANRPARKLLAELTGTDAPTVPNTWREPVAVALATGESQRLDVDGDRRTFAFTFAPIPENRQVNIYGMDVTERRQAEMRQRLIMRELDHRVKNNLAAVQSLAEQSLRHAGTMAEFRKAFLGRLQAMARTHEALAMAKWEGIDLRDAVMLVLGGYMDANSNRITLEGEDVRLPARAALPIGLALHELTTNAMKYGALSAAGGEVSLSWHQLDGRGLEICWRESAGPPVSPPEREGTGTILIRGLIGYELQGRVEMSYPSQGLVCKMLIPPPRSSDRSAAADSHATQPSSPEDAGP